jgi:hypothetical protein
MGSLYDAASRGFDRGFNRAATMQTYIDNIQRLEDEKALQEDQRRKAEAAQKFKYYGDILSNTDARLGLSDEQDAEIMANYRAAGSVLGVDAVDPMPLQQAMSVELFQMRTDPKWNTVPPIERLRYLKDRYGRHFNILKSQFRDMAVLQGDTQAQSTPQPNLGIQTAGIKESGQVQESGAKIMQPGTGYINTLPGGASEPAVNAPVETSPVSLPMPVQKSPEELEAEALFPDYEPVKPLDEQKKEWLNAYNNALATASKVKHLPGYVASILNRGVELGFLNAPAGGAWPQETIDNFGLPVIDPVKQRQEQLKLYDEFTEKIQKGQDVKSVVRAAYEAGLPDSMITALTTTPSIDPAKSAGLQNKDEDQKLAQQRLEIQQLTTDVRNAIAQGNLELATKRLELMQDKFTYQQEKGAGGASGKRDKSDPWLRDPSAKAAELNSEYRGKAQQYGFSTVAIMRGPDRIMKFFGTRDIVDHPYWKDVSGYLTLTKEGKARIKEINDTEDALYKKLLKGSASATVKGSGETKTNKATWGKTYSANQCGNYAKDYVNHYLGTNISNIGGLPTVSASKIQTNDIVYLGKDGKNTTNHYAVVLPNGNLSELITPTNGSPYISESRSLTSQKHRIQKVYRPGGKTASTGKTTRFATSKYRDAVRAMFKKGYTAEQVISVSPQWSAEAVKAEYADWEKTKGDMVSAADIVMGKPSTGKDNPFVRAAKQGKVK